MIDGVARVVGGELTFIGELFRMALMRAVTLNIEVSMSGLSVIGTDRGVDQSDIAERLYTRTFSCRRILLLGRNLLSNWKLYRYQNVFKHLQHRICT